MKSAYLFSTIVVATLILSGQPAWTQATAGQDEPRQVVISIYHIAPGKHVDFLKWMAAREAVSEAAGVAPTQWYVHVDGDSWDYVAISPDLSDEQQDKVNAETAKRGLTTGFAAGIELRHFIQSHTDTIVVGPVTASRLVSQAQGGAR